MFISIFSFFAANLHSSICRQEIVEEERIKIIQEHAGALIGFIPKDILRETDKQNFSFAGIQ